MSNQTKQNTLVHLWFKGEDLKNAVDKYTKIFENSKILRSINFDTPFDTTADCIEFTLGGRVFQAINAEPAFEFNNSFSFVVMCPSQEDLNTKWTNLISNGGKEIMPLEKTDFAECYGILEDEFGLTWHVFLDGQMHFDFEVVPVMMYPQGKTKEALEFYSTVFKDFAINFVDYLDEEKNNIIFSCFTINGSDYFAWDNLEEVDYPFNESTSIMIECETQEEIDYYWDKLSADKNDGQCGWTKDRFGLSWQIIPKYVNEVFFNQGKEKYNKISSAMLEMKKLDIEKLKQAAEQ